MEILYLYNKTINDMKRKIKRLSTELIDVTITCAKSLMFTIGLDSDMYPDFDFIVSSNINFDKEFTSREKEELCNDTFYDFLEYYNELEDFENFVLSQFELYFTTNNIKPLELC